VSTRAATGVEVLSSPAALDLVRLPTFCGLILTPIRVCLALPLPFQHLVEQTQPLLHSSTVPPSFLGIRRDYANRVAGGSPLEVIARPNLVAIGDGFGDG
jgi:hypothetical protein